LYTKTTANLCIANKRLTMDNFDRFWYTKLASPWNLLPLIDRLIFNFNHNKLRVNYVTLFVSRAPSVSAPKRSFHYNWVEFLDLLQLSTFFGSEMQFADNISDKIFTFVLSKTANSLSLSIEQHIFDTNAGKQLS
jgi:hypothetical protein